MSSLKTESLKGAKWGFIQKLTVQPVQLMYGMVLARLITPSEMGIVGLTAVFFAIATEMSMAGFSTALIRKQNRTDDDLNTMFWFNLTMSAVLGLILFLLAPWFADFFNQPELLWLTRISALILFLSSTAGVHLTIYQYNRDFRTLAIIGMITTFSGMPVCLFLAWEGYGVWALLAQNATSSLVNLFVVWKLSSWKPAFVFSRTSFASMFSFGSKLAVTSLLHIIYTNLRTFIIGKFYSPAQLGLYSRGEQLSGIVPSTINNVLSTISFPILATIQNENERLTAAYRKYIKISSVVIAWFCMTLAALAYPVVELAYGKNWIGCASFLQILCFVFGFDHICSINLNLLKVKGKSGAMLKLEIIKKLVSTLLLIYASTISVEAICIAMVIYSQIAVFINSYYTGKLINLSWWQQQKDYLPYFLLSAVCAVPAWLLSGSDLHSCWKIIYGGSTSLFLYSLVLYVLRESSFMELFSLIKSKLSNQIC